MTKKAINIFFYPVVIGFLLSIIIANHCDNAAAAKRIEKIIDTSAAVAALHENTASEAIREAERQTTMAADYRKQSSSLQAAADAYRTAGEKLRIENEKLNKIITSAGNPCAGVNFDKSSRIELIEISKKLCLLDSHNFELITGLNNEIDNYRNESRTLQLSLIACRNESSSLQAATEEQKIALFEKEQIIKEYRYVTIPNLVMEAKRKRGFWFVTRYALIGAASAALLIYLK